MKAAPVVTNPTPLQRRLNYAVTLLQRLGHPYGAVKRFHDVIQNPDLDAQAVNIEPLIVEMEKRLV
jgi:hypothetical protein